MTHVLYIGNYRHAHCTEVHLARDLENLGHTVVRLQEDPEWHQSSITPTVLYEAVETHAPDLVLWTRTWGLPPSAIKFWRWCEGTMAAVTASYHLDLYLGLRRKATMSPGSLDPFWTTQHVFSPDGNEQSEVAFKALGINHHFMPPAVVSDECVPGFNSPDLQHDVVFVGSENYHPEWPWRKQLLRGLRRRYGSRFAHYGHSWESTVRTDLFCGDERPGLHLNDLYRSAKVVVGDSLNLPGNYAYISDRYFEVMGRGGFLVGPYVPVLHDLGIIGGEHCVLYSGQDLEMVYALVDMALEATDDERRLIADHGQQYVATHHTYKQRLASALEIMELT